MNKSTPLNQIHAIHWLIVCALLLAVAPHAQATADTWTGSVNGKWSTAGNWTIGNAPPLAGDALIFDTGTDSSLTNDFTAGTAFSGITFDGNALVYTLTGNSVLLSGSASNTTGILNTSSQLETVNLNLTLDNGNYTFFSPNGGTIALDGTLSLSAGSVALFDTSVSSTSLTTDATGLIAGVGGAGFMYNFGNNAPTGLAAISGGTVTPFTAYSASLASGAISSGNNIKLTANGSSATYTTASGVSVNTLTVAQAGGTGGPTSTINVTGTLTLGANGGINVLNSTGTNHGQFSLSGGTLTAGTSGPASIVFAVVGSNPNNQASVSSTIVNNTGGGPVTVILTGGGSMNFATTTTSSYSGGVYVNQGQLQFGQVQQLGTGAAHVAGGGSLYFTGTGTITNNISLSPGIGAGSSSAVTGGAGLIGAGTGTTTFGGVITLNGAAVPSPSVTSIAIPTGDTFSGNGTGGTFAFTNQITGTGTLELTAAHTCNIVFKNTSAVSTNNWQGGLIVGGHSGIAANVQIQTQAANQIPSGPNAGDLTLIPATTAVYARLDLDGNSQTINGLVGTSGNINSSTYEAQVTNSASTTCTLTLGAGNSTAQFNGAIADGSTARAISLVKVGTGTQTLAGLATHNGNTTVSAGTLVLSGTANPANTPTISVASGATLSVGGLNAGGLTISSSQTLNGIGAVLGTVAVSGKINPFLTTVGTLVNDNGVTFNNGGTYVWDMNNATGAAGTGWSQLNITNGTLTVNASTTPFIIKITSLTTNNVAGSAANFNPSVSNSWAIVKCSSPISGFSAGNFTLDHSSFSNALGSGAFTIGLSPDSMSLVLSFTSTPVITTPLVNTTNNAGTTATFTVVANGASLPVTFTWTDPNGNTLADGGTTFSGSGASIGITNSGHTSTLTIGGSGVEDGDAGIYTVSVSDTIGDSGTSGGALVVIDPPSSPTIVQSVGPGLSSGGVVDLTASAGGTPPFTYTWYDNGVVVTNGAGVSGATSSNLVLNLTPARAGNYTVVISNPAGSVTNSPFVVGPVSSVPGQIIFESFDSYTPQVFVSGGGGPADTFEVTPQNPITNLFNEITGGPAFWFHSSGSGTETVVQLNDMNTSSGNQNGGSYPWPGLAGGFLSDGNVAGAINEGNCLYWTESLNSHLEFGQTESFPTNSKVYFSFIMSCVSLGSVNSVEDVLAGFTTSNSGTAFNYQLCSMISNEAAQQYQLGVGKANGVGSTQTVVPANTAWASTPITAQQDVLVVGCYSIVSGGNTATDDTVSLWINPDPSTFYAAETNVPTPSAGPASFGVANSEIRDFAIHSTSPPASHRIADLRIGTTWASVTPPSAPTLSLSNLAVNTGATATFTSQNAGNPVLTYSWQHNGTNLMDGGHITGSATYALTITGVSAADLGTYTVTGVNNDPLTNTISYTNSASATLTIAAPTLQLVSTGTSVVLSWPTNFAGFKLEQSSSILAGWTTNSMPPYAVVGTNYVVTNTVSGTKFYRLAQ